VNYKARASAYRRLSNRQPLGDANGQACFQCVIVGSGFGGSVMAARLAPYFKPGQLAVLERGKEVQPGDFPATLAKALFEVKTPVNPLGLFDFSVTPDMDSLVGNALGGTSNIYANVMLEPLPELFETPPAPANRPYRWPSAITYDALKPYFKRVRHMLAVEKYIDRDDLARGVAVRDPAVEGSFFYGAEQGNRSDSDQPLTDYRERTFAERPPLAKASYLRDSLPYLHPLNGHRPANGSSPQADQDHFEKLPLAINLTQVGQGQPNAFGVPQWKCILCGDCVTGCNVGAKNSLTMNYLPLAEKLGASLFSQVEVRAIRLSERADYRYRLLVVTRVHENGKLRKRELEIHTRMLVLSAGVFGTVKLLLEAQQQGDLTFSARLGRGFSGNADEIAISYNGERRLDSVGYGHRESTAWEAGPTISAMVDFRRVPDRQHVIQDGAFPSLLVRLASLVFSLRHLWRGNRRVWHDLLKAGAPARLNGALNHSQIWLAIGYDQADGELWLDGRERLRLRWRGSGTQPALEAIRQTFANLSRVAGASHLENPRERFSWLGRQGATPITVHPLGGCCMGDDIEQGVVDDVGRVFDPGGGVFPGLYVNDGSICNASLGANPSLTIAALAERASDRIIQQDLKRLFE
jgi:cholesterol oxidase